MLKGLAAEQAYALLSAANGKTPPARLSQVAG